MKQSQAHDYLGNYAAPFIAAVLLLCFSDALFATTPAGPDEASPSEADFSSTIEQDLATSSNLSVLDLEWSDIEQQIDVGELDDARFTLERRVGELQTLRDRYDSQLIKPLSLLGRVYHEQKDYPRAVETFALATQISRIANGLHSAEQLHLVHQEIASLKAMGNIIEANRRHEYAFSIAARHYGRYAEKLIPELLKMGAWYTSTGDIIGARGRFSDARVLLSANRDMAQSDLMILALRGLANSYREERYPPFYERPNRETEALFDRNGLNERQASVAQMTEQRLTVNTMHRGTEALVEVLRIQGNRLLAEQEQFILNNPPGEAVVTTSSTNAPDATSKTPINAQTDSEAPTAIVSGNRRNRGESLNLDAIEPAVGATAVDKNDFLAAMLELADWYLLMGQESRAFAWYQQAYTIAEADPNNDAAAMFGEPRLLYFPRPKDPKLPERVPPNALEQGHVALLYDIDHKGHVKRLRTVESQPKGLMDFHVRSSARIARYRPRIKDGLPQPTAAQTYKHSFSYFPRNRETPTPNVINSDDLANDSAPEVPASATSGR